MKPWLTSMLSSPWREMAFSSEIPTTPYSRGVNTVVGIYNKSKYQVREEQATKLSPPSETDPGNPSPCLPYRSPSGPDSPQTSGPPIAVQP